jgi:uncharacterized membrane protein YccC
MGYVLASSGLAPWGQTAAIILALYTFVSIIVGLALVAALMFAFAWLREKSELIKRLRPTINETNSALEIVKRGDPLPSEMARNKLVSAVAQAPKIATSLPSRASSIDAKVERGSERVADVVIEFRARTQMVKGMARAFFLPGLTKRRISVSAELPRQIEREQIIERAEIAPARREQEERPMEREIVITR